MRVPSPRGAAYLVAAILSIWFAYDLMRKPVQLSDSLIYLMDAQASPSVSATFVAHWGRGPFLRPFREAQVKALFELAGGRYWLVFRSFHVLLLAAAIFLFVTALQIGTWTDFAAAMFALTVFTGLHTFRGTVREAFPINHFLEVVVFCLVALNLAQSRGGWLVDLAAGVTFAVATLTLESGVLVWMVIVAAWASGMRGVSRRGVAIVTGLLVAYAVLRLTVVAGPPGLVGRDSGLWATMLSSDEIDRRFSADPTWFYVYNVATSVLSVLFSDPDRGVFHLVRTWLNDEMPRRLYLAVISSTVTTGLMLWAVVRWFRVRRFAWAMDPGDRLFFIFPFVLLANACVGYAYPKHEILSVAGAFYALAAFAAARHWLAYADGTAVPAVKRALLCVVLGALAAGWAFRSVGVHHLMQTHAYRERLEWARLTPETLESAGYPSSAEGWSLATVLRQEALDLRMANPHELPGWADDWWGE